MSDGPRHHAAAVSGASTGSISKCAAEENLPPCVVCLQPCQGAKACKCSHMHRQCAESYREKVYLPHMQPHMQPRVYFHSSHLSFTECSVVNVDRSMAPAASVPLTLAPQSTSFASARLITMRTSWRGTQISVGVRVRRWSGMPT